MSKDISGRLAARAVGILELLIALLLLAGYGYWVSCRDWAEDLQVSKVKVEIGLFGVYALIGVIMSLMLIISTFSLLDLNRRKWVAVSWCCFDMLSFIGSVVGVCVCEQFSTRTDLLLVMVLFLLKWSIFFCVVFTYVWGLSEKIQDSRIRMPVSPIRMGQRRPVLANRGGIWLMRNHWKKGEEPEDGNHKMKISMKL